MANFFTVFVFQAVIKIKKSIFEGLIKKNLKKNFGKIIDQILLF